MAFENARRILSIGSVSSSYKLLLMQGASSRPALGGMFRALLQPFVKDGRIAVQYRCRNRMVKSFVRVSELESDFYSTRELGVDDIYPLDSAFHPELVIDGGGNIGLFTLTAAACLEASGDASAKLVVCEPVPTNIERIKEHLALNGVTATVMPVCLGGSLRVIPFYCREANQGSFDSVKPYTSVIEIPVVTLKDVIGESRAERILIKLDIEGMEVETLRTFLAGERRAIYVVGELHNCSVNAALMEQIFHTNGWTLEIHGTDNDRGFRGCSPAALPLLPSFG
jgi:FkbM family methyltransferase